jgi:transposase-like protein
LFFERDHTSRSLFETEIYFNLPRDVEELLSIRGVPVDPATIQRWVFKFTPLIGHFLLTLQQKRQSEMLHFLHKCLNLKIGIFVI